MPPEVFGFLDSEEQLPFEHLFSSLVVSAREELRRRADPTAHGLLASAAHSGWERYLLRRLTSAGAKAAHSKFEIFKSVRAAFSEDQPSGQKDASILYRQFVGEQPEVRLQKIFSELPALRNLCVKLIDNWLSTVTEFLTRLRTDCCDLARHFRIKQLVCPITCIEAGLSDPHRGGRCVVRARFENGPSIVYKPRSIAPEAQFSTLIQRLNSTDIPHGLRAARCWDRAEYGWIEDITASPCGAVADVHAFYWRAGALLGIVTIARGVDFHLENLVAAGVFPVLIDLETLWHPQEHLGNQSPLAVPPVLRTGFLPQPDRENRPVYEWSALSKGTFSEHPTIGWTGINGDAMTLELTRRRLPDWQHVPIVDGITYWAPEYTEDIQGGFRWLGERLLVNEDSRRETKQWLNELVRCRRRRVLRSSALYQNALQRLTTPENLRGEKSVLLWQPERVEKFESAWMDEVHALEELDVPYFEQPDSSNDQSLDTKPPLISSEEYKAQLPVIGELLRNGL